MFSGNNLQAASSSILMASIGRTIPPTFPEKSLNTIVLFLIAAFSKNQHLMNILH